MSTIETKTPSSTSSRGIELSNYEKGGTSTFSTTSLSTKTDDPPAKNKNGLGLLANEDWILSLGSANAHDLDHIHKDTEKVERLQNRLTATSSPKPWKFLPQRYMNVLSKTFQCFEHEMYFDDPKKNREQHNNLLELTALFNEFNSSIENEVLYDVCESFHTNIYPLLELFEAHCLQATNETMTPDRMQVRVDISYYYDVYRRVLSSRLGQDRDNKSYLSFDELVLTVVQKQISTQQVDTSTTNTTSIAMNGTSTPPSSPTSNGNNNNNNNNNNGNSNNNASAGGSNNMIGASMAVSGSSGILYDEPNTQRNRCQRLCCCLKHIPGCRRFVNPKRSKHGNDGEPLDYLDPNISLSDVLSRLKYEQHKKAKRKRRARLGANYIPDEEDDDMDENNTTEKHKKKFLIAKLGDVCDRSIVFIVNRGMVVLPFVPLVINIILSFGLDSEIFFSYVPSERDHTISYMLLGSAIADVLTVCSLLVYFYKGSKRGRFNEIVPGDRIIRIRPLFVIVIAFFCAAISFRYAGGMLQVTKAQHVMGVVGKENLVPFSLLSIVGHLISIIIVYSIKQGFVKKVKRNHGTVTYCNIVCLCSFVRVINTGRWCCKPAYRADAAGKGLHLMLRDKNANERKLAYIMSFPDWNTNIQTRKQVRYIRSENKLYRKAVKNMKVEIAVKMMSAMYVTKEKAQANALPCEICICAVFFSSYHNIKEYVTSNFRIKRQLERVMAMDQVWYALVTRYQYALNGDDRHLLKACEHQLKIYLQRDRNLHQLKLSQYQAKERLKNLVQKFGKKKVNERNERNDTNNNQAPLLPSSRLVYEGVLGREELYKELLSMQSEQMALNSRISSYNIEKLEYKHEDWSAAAAAANEMNVLHKGWRCRPLNTYTKSGKMEYLYYNRKLNAKLRQRIAAGITKKQLPTYMKKVGIICPQSNLWTAKNVFETFHKIVRLNLPKYRHDKTYQRDYRVVLPHVQNISRKEYIWGGSDRDLQDKLQTYIGSRNSEVEDSFGDVRQQINEASMNDTDDIDIFEVFMGSEEEEESDED